MTQRSNPHQLTVNQHILPRRSIERFSGQGGFVQLRRIGNEGYINVPPQNPLFCAKRVWDQRAETTLSRDTEAAFQGVADQLVESSLLSLRDDMHIAVTEMYLLWRHRALFARSPFEDMKIKIVGTERELSKDSEEYLEAGGVFFTRKDGTIPGRFITGINLQRAIDMDLCAGADKMRWGVVRAPAGIEFLVPDAFVDQPVMPVSPKVCLVSGLPDCQLSLSGVGLLNREALLSAHGYWFARSLECCPVWNRTLPWGDA